MCSLRGAAREQWGLFMLLRCCGNMQVGRLDSLMPSQT